MSELSILEDKVQKARLFIEETQPKINRLQLDTYEKRYKALKGKWFRTRANGSSNYYFVQDFLVYDHPNQEETHFQYNIILASLYPDTSIDIKSYSMDSGRFYDFVSDDLSPLNPKDVTIFKYKLKKNFSYLFGRLK
jgi:hypothetical protein